MNSSNTINILQWNCRSIRSNRESLLQLLHQHNIHIVLLSETWLLPNEHFNFPNFQIYRNDRADGHGGVMILVRNYLYSSRLTIQPYPLQDLPTSSLIAVSIHLSNRILTLASLYIPQQLISIPNA